MRLNRNRKAMTIVLSASGPGEGRHGIRAPIRHKTSSSDLAYTGWAHSHAAGRAAYGVRVLMGSGRALAIWCAISAGVRQLVSTVRSAARIIHARDDRYSARWSRRH